MRNEAERRAKLTARLEKANLDGLFVVNPTNVSYLTGFNGEDSYLWIGDSGAVLLSDSRFEEQIKEETPDLPALIRDGETTFGLLEKALGDKRFSSVRPKRIGFEADSTTVALLERLQSGFPGVEWVPRLSEIEKLREIKDASEIAAIRAAIDVSIDAYRTIRSSLDPFATEADVRDELEYQMRKRGGDGVSFPTIVAFDARAALPHAIPKRGKTVAETSLVLVDWGAVKNGYVGDLTRSFRTERGLLAGNAEFERRFRQVFDVVRAARDAAISAMKPNVPCNKIDEIARSVIADAGFGDYFGHGLGHGIGRVVHDFGGLTPRQETLLAPGMVLTVEPGIYLPGWGGIRLEDDVLVVEKGVEILSERLPLDDVSF